MKNSEIVIRNLSVKFGEFYALENLNLQIPENSFVAIVGPNGAGKSTFLKVLLGLQTGFSGEVKIFNREIKDVSPEWIGYVPQFKTMDRRFPALSIELVLTGIYRIWPWRWKKEESSTGYFLCLQGFSFFSTFFKPGNSTTGFSMVIP